MAQASEYWWYVLHHCRCHARTSLTIRVTYVLSTIPSFRKAVHDRTEEEEENDQIREILVRGLPLKASNQGNTGLCFAYAAAMSIHILQSRIFGTNQTEDHREELRLQLVKRLVDQQRAIDAQKNGGKRPNLAGGCAWRTLKRLEELEKVEEDGVKIHP